MNAATTTSPPPSSFLHLPHDGPWRRRRGSRDVIPGVHLPPLRVSSSLFGRTPDPYKTRRNSKLSRPSPEERKFEFSVDVDEIAGRASADLRRFYRSSEARFRRFLSFSREAYHDLRTSVKVDHGRRNVFSCNRSSLIFVADVVLWTLLVVVSARVLLWLGLGLRSRWGSGDWWVVRRDRGLGGREVVVGRRSKGREVDWRGSKVLPNPLSPPRGAQTRTREAALKMRRVLREEKLPEWWPSSAPLSPALSVGKEEQQREANRLVRAIMDNRMSGRDYKEDDMIQLRQICRMFGVKVSFDTVNARDSFYRASVDFILNACSRVVQPTAHVQIDGEEVQQFIAGLADNIGLENVRAARILRAAVAARTRSRFLQAWALEVQGQRSEALEELSKICLILQIFPPEEQSPEMEMVATGLEKNLKVEQRAHLLNLLGGVCGTVSRRIAAEALGLVRTVPFQLPCHSLKMQIY